MSLDAADSQTIAVVRPGALFIPIAQPLARVVVALLEPQDFRTLEDVVRELLRPLLKQWLDENLPAIVEAQVQSEIERISRSGRVR